MMPLIHSVIGTFDLIFKISIRMDHESLLSARLWGSWVWVRRTVSEHTLIRSTWCDGYKIRAFKPHINDQNYLQRGISAFTQIWSKLCTFPPPMWSFHFDAQSYLMYVFEELLPGPCPPRIYTCLKIKI